MNMGLILFALLIVILMAIPFSRWINWQYPYRQQKNIALYQQLMASKPSAELADEFAQRLLADEKQLKNSPHFSFVQQHRFSFKSAVLFSLILIGLPYAYYATSGRYQALIEGEQAFLQQQMTLMEQAISQQNEDKVTQIQQKLRQDPNNAQDWLALGQAYVANDEFANALIAYQNAQLLLGEQPYILTAMATALYYQEGKRLTPSVTDLLQRGLALDPQDTAGLSLLATEAFVQQDYAKAIAIWQQMLDSERSNIERRTLIQRIHMAEIQQKTQFSQ